MAQDACSAPLATNRHPQKALKPLQQPAIGNIVHALNLTILQLQQFLQQLAFAPVHTLRNNNLKMDNLIPSPCDIYAGHASARHPLSIIALRPGRDLHSGVTLHGTHDDVAA